MKVIELQNNFGLENLAMNERSMPEPGYGQVLVKMQAAALNYRDLLMVRGHYNPRQSLPLIPASDGAGEVVGVGDGVVEIKVGDRVASNFFQDWNAGAADRAKVKTTLGGPLDGTLAEYMVLPEQGVIRVPQHLTPVQAATLPCAALTAWNALVGYGNLKAGDKVLIQGTGGVALFALQFAKIFGAEVVITSSSDAKLNRAKELGADHGINYRETPQWGKIVNKMTGGVDLVVELGGAATLPESFQACRLGASIMLIGVLSGISQDFNILPIIMNNLRVQGIFVGNHQHFAEMNRAISYHSLLPVIDKTFALAQADKAFEYLASAAHFGKICVTI